MQKEMQEIAVHIKKTAFCLLGLLVCLFMYLSYLQIVEGNYLLNHPLNRRNLELARKIPPGMIVDRNGKKLAYSKREKAGFKRQYPYGAMLANVVGYDSTTYGKAGIEASMAGYLTGINNPARYLGPVAQLIPPQSGANVVLTIDAALQETAYKALGDKRGAIIVMAPHTGEILAMVSKPSFDPNLLDKEWDEVAHDASSPLLNRATQGLYPPGSTIKIMMAEGALHEKVVDPQHIFTCNGKLKIGDYELTEENLTAHGKVNLASALAVSCNITFGTIALEMGADKVAKTFERYGFNKPLPEELQEVGSRLPDFGSLGQGDLAQTGIGQSSLLVTPLRMAMVASSFANKGIIMKPHVIKSIVTADGNMVKEYTPDRWLTVTDARLADLVAKMMVKVVEEGTGTAARISGISVAGKTGTAENPHGASHAWFIGFAPVENPQVVVAVIVENGGAGGAVAAPIARQLFIKALH